MWPAVLATRLQANRPMAGVGVVNAATSGNRVLGDNNSGLARLARDALAVPGVRWMTMIEGINDITGATRSGQAGKSFTAEKSIAAYRQVIETAHAQRSGRRLHAHTIWRVECVHRRGGSDSTGGEHLDSGPATASTP